MENLIIATGLGVTLTISIILGIVISYLKLIIRKLDRVSDCFISNEIDNIKTTFRTSKGLESRLCEEYINSLLNQIRTAANQISEVGVENLKLRSDLELNKIEIEGYKLRIEKLLKENKDLKDKLENEQRTTMKSGE